MSWKAEADKLFAKHGRSWSRIAKEMAPLFPELSHLELKEKIRSYIRKTPAFDAQQQSDFQRSSLEYKRDGTIISQKLITVRDGDDMTPDFIVEAHGLKPSAW